MADDERRAEIWQPPDPPRDGTARMHRVYGYRYTGEPQFPLGESLGQQGVGTTDLDMAIALRDRLQTERPEHRWVIEWTVI